MRRGRSRAGRVATHLAPLQPTRHPAVRAPRFARTGVVCQERAGAVRSRLCVERRAEAPIGHQRVIFAVRSRVAVFVLIRVASADRSRRCGFVVGRALRRALSGVGRSSWFARGARRAHFPAARSTPHAHIMPSLTVKPCAQRHEWNLYLNASMFTSTTALDPVFISEVNATAKVGETIDFVRARAGRADRAPPRRVDGFEETWTKVLYRGQELDQSMSWDEVGLFAARGDADDEDVVVTVVWKEIAAEGYKVATDAMDDVSTDEDEGEF